jgi:hypothetical protein
MKHILCHLMLYRQLTDMHCIYLSMFVVFTSKLGSSLPSHTDILDLQPNIIVETAIYICILGSQIFSVHNLGFSASTECAQWSEV